MNNGFEFIENISADDFVFKMLELGTPIETSLVGAFDNEGRGSRRDIDLPLHQDGDYSTDYKDRIDYVGFVCVRSGGTAVTVVEDTNKNLHYFKLKKGEALIIDNKQCRHAREGYVEDRILLRIWIKKLDILGESNG